MNKNTLYAAIPFAVVSDGALMVKGFSGYSDPTLTVLAVACAVIAIGLMLKAFDLLHLPRYSGSSCQDEVREVHHHHYHEDECDDDSDNSDEEDEDHYQRGYEDGKEAGSDTSNYDEGFVDGVESRKAEEQTEAKELARYIMAALKIQKEQEAAPQAPVAEPAPVATATPTEPIQHDGNA